MIILFLMQFLMILDMIVLIVIQSSVYLLSTANYFLTSLFWRGSSFHLLLIKIFVKPGSSVSVTTSWHITIAWGILKGWIFLCNNILDTALFIEIWRTHWRLNKISRKNVDFILNFDMIILLPFIIVNFIREFSL